MQRAANIKRWNIFEELRGRARRAAGRVALVALTVALPAGCARSELYGKSDVQAQAFILERIPVGTAREQARLTIQKLRPDKVAEEWNGAPPDAASTLSAWFDSEGGFQTSFRYVALTFAEGATLESVEVSTAPKIIVP